MPSRSETHALILETATELFSSFGPQRTTVADIARALRMSPANVYKFFPSKDAIVEAVGERFMTALHRELVPLIRARKPAWARIEDLVRAVNRHFADMIETNVSRHGARFFQNVIEFEMLKREHKWRFVEEFVHSTLRLEVAKLLREGVETDGWRVEDPSLHADTFLNCLACSIEPVMMIGIPRDLIETRLERQLALLARTLT